MKGIEKLPHLTTDQKKLLDTSELNYKRFARIYFEVLEVSADSVKIKVHQKENPAEKYLNRDELIDRAKEVFAGIIPSEWDMSFVSVPYKGELDSVDLGYIERKKTELGLSDIDLSRMLDIRKENLSRILSQNNERDLTKWHKAAFYYLFKSLEK